MHTLHYTHLSGAAAGVLLLLVYKLVRAGAGRLSAAALDKHGTLSATV